MGLTRVNGINASTGHRLRVLADELEPDRGPWWVSQPGGQTPAQGWWWTPRDATAPAFLGHNGVVAEMALRRLIEAEA